MNIIDMLNQYDTITYYDEHNDEQKIQFRITCTYERAYKNEFDEVVLETDNGSSVCVFDNNNLSYQVQPWKFNRDIIILNDGSGHSTYLIAKKI